MVLEGKERSTYNNRPIHAALNHARRMLLLLPRLYFLDLGRLARRRQAHSYICDLQNSQGCQDAEQRGHGVCDDAVEAVGVEREDDERVHLCVDACDVVVERLDRRRGSGFGLREPSRVDDGGFAGHGAG